MAGAAAIKWDASGTNPNPDAVEQAGDVTTSRKTIYVDTEVFYGADQ
jgi:hypothetical protein